MGNLDPERVISEVENTLLDQKRRTYLIELPDYVASNVWVILVTLRVAPTLMQRIEGLGPSVRNERNLPISVDIITVLEQRFESARKSSRGSRLIPINISFDEIETLAKKLKEIGGTTSIEAGFYLMEVYDAFVQSGGNDEPEMVNLIESLRESKPFNYQF